MPTQVERLWAGCITALQSLADLPVGSPAFHAAAMNVMTPLADLKQLAAAGYKCRKAEWDTIVNTLKVSCWLHTLTCEVHWPMHAHGHAVLEECSTQWCWRVEGTAGGSSLHATGHLALGEDVNDEGKAILPHKWASLCAAAAAA